MTMETLLIINSVLVGICLYFVTDSHKDFKKMNDAVQTLKEKYTELSTKVNIHIQSIKDRLRRLDKIKEEN